MRIEQKLKGVNEVTEKFRKEIRKKSLKRMAILGLHLSLIAGGAITYFVAKPFYWQKQQEQVQIGDYSKLDSLKHTEIVEAYVALGNRICEDCYPDDQFRRIKKIQEETDVLIPASVFLRIYSSLGKRFCEDNYPDDQFRRLERMSQYSGVKIPEEVLHPMYEFCWENVQRDNYPDDWRKRAGAVEKLTREQN